MRNAFTLHKLFIFEQITLNSQIDLVESEKYIVLLFRFLAAASLSLLFFIFLFYLFWLISIHPLLF